MKSDAKRLAAEMAAIVLIAAVIGIAWNHRLLLNVFRGEGVKAQQTPAAPKGAPAAAPTAAAALPLGLMQVKELFDTGEAIIIDARDREAYRKGHIKGAMSLPVGEAGGLITPFADRTPKDKLLVVYCGGYDCHDSKLLGEKLLAAGFTQVFVYEGGYPEWQDAGHPVTKGDK
ncbi:Rhodanese domain protein [Geobacter metallireducens RCH3]|uniref:Rhodanese homology domain superfamily protein n=1 Tax=Geobacter metallireducens (strain ATCC 53774 / DSM 7210 / GS-15) TaxID=269799 RepID=Q39R91_GEOMG|nr:rhodanese-like domain-containing protein [Geobacter metallireducens]ABB33233.1 rhodanese homology domain superfamily protein [Geobacter metallireducens GS-15]EHP84668.1 Rhodanese domain protein [Geobacter metallireducens RCH3]